MSTPKDLGYLEKEILKIGPIMYCLWETIMGGLIGDVEQLEAKNESD